MEQEINGRQLQMKTTSIEDNLMQDNLNERQPLWKTILKTQP